MPNHITNKILIKDSKVLNDVIDYMSNNENNDEIFTFEKIIPMPEYVYKGLLSPKEEELYGANNCWYNWSLKHWGTKWDAYNSYIDNQNRISFNTAWSGVPRLIGLLSQKFPNAEFIYKYADEDCGANTDYYRFLNGQVLEHRDIKNCSYSAYKTYLDCKDMFDNSCYRIYVDRNENVRLVYIVVQRLK